MKRKLKLAALIACAFTATAACVLQYQIDCKGYATSLYRERTTGQWEWCDGTLIGTNKYVDCWGMGTLTQVGTTQYTCVLCGTFTWRSDGAPAGTNCVNQTKYRQNCAVTCNGNT